MHIVSQQEIWNEIERYYVDRIAALENQVKMLNCEVSDLEDKLLSAMK